MLTFFVERLNAKVSGDIVEKMVYLQMDWEMLADGYNAIVSSFRGSHQYNTETLKSLIFNGDITLKELTIVLAVLSSKPLFTVAPLTSNDTIQADQWAKR